MTRKGPVAFGRLFGAMLIFLCTVFLGAVDVHVCTTYMHRELEASSLLSGKYIRLP